MTAANEHWTPPAPVAPRRVVVTGLGMVTALGLGAEHNWQAMLTGTNGIRNVTLCDASDLDSKVAGEVPDWDPLNFMDRKEARRTDRFVQFAIAAAGEALAQSGIDVATHADRIGAMIGAGMGGLTTLEDEFKTLFDKGPNRVSPFLVPMFISDMAAGQVSIQLRIDRSTPANRHMLGHGGNLCAHGIACLPQLVHERFELPHDLGVRRKEWIGVHGFPALKGSLDRPELAKVATDDNSVLFLQPFSGNRCRCHSHGRFPRRGAPPAAVIANSVLLPVGIVGVARTKGVDEVAVVTASLVFVPDQEGDGRTGRLALEYPGKNFNGIGFLPLRDVA